MKNNTVFNTKSVKSAYPLRNKFVKLLNEAGMAENSLDDAFVIAEYMSPDSLLKKLWGLSFSSSQESVLYDLKLVSREYYANTSNTYIPAELVIPFRNELRFQYTLAHKDFLTINEASCREYSPIFEQFVKEMGMDKILSAGLMILVLDFLALHLWKDEHYVEKTLFLLKSSNKKYIHGGLKNIGLTQNEARELSTRSIAIAKLMDGIKFLGIKNGALPLSNEIFLNFEGYKPESRNWTTPMANLADKLKENGIDLPDEAQPDEIDKADETDEQESHGIEVLNSESSSVEIKDTVPSISGTIAEDFDGSADYISEEFSLEPDIVNPRTTNLENSFTAVTPMAVLQNMDVLKEFIHATNEVAYAGFSVKEVLEKISAIRKLLDGFEALS